MKRYETCGITAKYEVISYYEFLMKSFETKKGVNYKEFSLAEKLDL
jgi:hypothetical protein